MKYLFAIVFVVLAAASMGTYWSYPDVASPVPVIYWTTDRNPAREQQVDTFHRWMIEQGYGEKVTLSSAEQAERFLAQNWSPTLVAAMREANPRGPELWAEDLTPRPAERITLPATVMVPAAELRLDMGNRGGSKQIIQGVSGVASDVMDIGSPQIHYLQSVGIFVDITEAGRAHGFSPDDTWQAVGPDITVVNDQGQRRQYVFPANVATPLWWVNKDTFRRYGQPIPPRRWTIEEFERRGKAFVEAANANNPGRRVYFIADVNLLLLTRSLGLSIFNETMTRSTLGDERFVRALKLKHKWIYEDQLIPSAAERKSFDTQAGYGGATPQLFNSGNYAMYMTGRYGLIQLRRFGEMDLTVVEPAHGGFPVTSSSTRAVGVYVAGEHQDQAERFLEYLASEAYNMLIVEDADALPPNPRYTETEAFRRPPAYPNEWGVHERFAQAAEQIAIGTSFSPFILTQVVMRELKRIEDMVLNGRISPEAAAAAVATRINAQIQYNLEEDPRLREQYEALMDQQARIDELRERGEPVPLELITNPFHRRYYQHMGWAE